MAARLVSEGKIPYHDFFLPQGPMLPAFFGAFFLALGRTWLLARILAGVLAVIIGLLVYLETLAATRRPKAAVFAAIVFAFAGDTIGWLTIVKGFGLTALWTLAATSLAGGATRASTNRRRNLAAAASGVAMGFAVSTRLYVVLAVPMVALYLVRELGFSRPGLRRVGLLILGFGVGVLPLIVSYAIDRKAFLFDTFLFHGVREYGQSSLFGTLSAKWPTILKAFGLQRRAPVEGQQILGLTILAAAAWLARMISRKPYGSATAYVWPALVIASLLPNPLHSQYLALLMPFFAIEAGRLLGTLLDGFSRWKMPVLAVSAIVCALGYTVFHVRLGWMERDRYLRTGTNVPGVESTDRVPNWRIATVEAVAKKIDAQGIAEAASWWPGYFISCKTNLFLPLANDFGFRAAAALSAKERRRYHVRSHDEVSEIIQKKALRLFVEGSWAFRPTADLLPKNGYKLQDKLNNVKLWTIQ